MVIFFDSSALLKRYIAEQGSDLVHAYFSEHSDILIAPITRIEIENAINRAVLIERLDSNAARRAIDLFQNELAAFSIAPFIPALELEAIEIAKQHQLKSLDCIQLASAIVSHAEQFVTSERKLYEKSQHAFPGESVYI